PTAKSAASIPETAKLTVSGSWPELLTTSDAFAGFAVIPFCAFGKFTVVFARKSVGPACVAIAESAMAFEGFAGSFEFTVTVAELKPATEGVNVIACVQEAPDAIEAHCGVLNEKSLAFGPVIAKLTVKGFEAPAFVMTNDELTGVPTIADGNEMGPEAPAS